MSSSAGATLRSLVKQEKGEDFFCVHRQILANKLKLIDSCMDWGNDVFTEGDKLVKVEFFESERVMEGMLNLPLDQRTPAPEEEEEGEGTEGLNNPQVASLRQTPAIPSSTSQGATPYTHTTKAEKKPSAFSPFHRIGSSACATLYRVMATD